MHLLLRTYTYIYSRFINIFCVDVDLVSALGLLILGDGRLLGGCGGGLLPLLLRRRCVTSDSSDVVSKDPQAQGAVRAQLVLTTSRRYGAYLFARLSSMRVSETFDFQIGRTSSCVSL